MRFPKLVTTLTAACALVGACASDTGAQTPAARGASAPDLSTVAWLSSCQEPGLDPRALCGTYPVWEDRNAAAGRKIGIAVIVVPAAGDDRRPDAYVYLAGGPGGSGRNVAWSAGREPWATINRERDLLFMDRRGVGRSHGLDCDLYDDDPQAMLQEFLPAAAVEACRRELERTADLTLYGSAPAMDDFDEIRAALGYEQVNLHGTSYGTREAQVWMRRHPGSVRSAILLGVADPTLYMPLPYPRDTEAALEAVIAACAAEAECAAAYPDLRDELFEVAARLEREPGVARVTSSAEGAPGVSLNLRYGRTIYAEMVRYLLYSTAHSNRLPALVHAAHEGDFRPLTVYSLERRQQLADNLGLFLSVTCTQDVPFIDSEEARTVAEGTLLGLYRYEQQHRACSLWPRGTVTPAYHEPLVTDVPVLLISGAYDPVTPPSRGERLAAHLGRSRHLVVPGAGHGMSGVRNGACIDRAMVDFLSRGLDAVDASCVPTMTRLPFQVE